MAGVRLGVTQRSQKPGQQGKKMGKEKRREKRREVRGMKDALEGRNKASKGEGGRGERKKRVCCEDGGPHSRGAVEHTAGWEQLSASICSVISGQRVVSRKPKENTSSSFFFSSFRDASPFRSYTGYPPSIFHSHSSRPIAGIVHAVAILRR